jgi:hypothetical protein
MPNFVNVPKPNPATRDVEMNTHCLIRLLRAREPLQRPRRMNRCRPHLVRAEAQPVVHAVAFDEESRDRSVPYNARTRIGK